MPREKTVSGEGPTKGRREDPDELRFIWNLRPRTLDEYIGQPQVVESLRIATAAAKGRGDPLDHLLFHGPPGLGKTTLAHIIAREMQTNITHTSGPALEKPGDIVGILSNLEEGEVLFIDEIHRLSHTVEEFLYSAMEEFRVSFVAGKGDRAKTIPLPIHRFTLVGATTRAGLLSAPLRDRFGIICHLDFYSDEELAQVVRRSAAILELPIDDDAAPEIAKRSRGTPRIANRLLRRVRDYAQIMGDGRVSLAITSEALAREGVDQKGLDRLDRLYLATIIDHYDGGPVGLEALAATLNEDPSILVDVVEPFLLKTGFIARTPAGRRASELAREHLGRLPSASSGGQSRLF